MTYRRLAVLCDYLEEGWPSMDLCAEMLLRELGRRDDVAVTRVRPPFRERAGRLPFVGWGKRAFNADRLLNRFVDYPLRARALAREHDLFHVVDHSYGQLVKALPAARTGVFCHDLDTFRCVLEPARDPRPRWFRAVARRSLEGLQAAALVFHTTEAVGDELRRSGLVAPDRLVAAPLGVAPEFTPEPEPGAPPLVAGPYLLHVGSCIPRKRVDVVLEVAAALRREQPELRLVKVGGPWAPEHRAQVGALGSGLVVFTGIPREQLAGLYRRAALVLHPSAAEGFGLPLIEALACGAPVLASDIPAHREVGGDAIATAPVGDVPAWIEAARAALSAGAAGRAARLAQAARYSWARHAEAIWGAYRRLP